MLWLASKLKWIEKPMGLITLITQNYRDLISESRGVHIILSPPLPPLEGMPVHCGVNPSIKFTGTHLYTWVERGTVRVKCFAQEHNTKSSARAWTRTAQFGVKRTNHEATAPRKRILTLNYQIAVHLFTTVI